MNPNKSMILQYLTFCLDGEVFALEILKVREVLEFRAMTRVPQTPPFMRGVINLRGNVVPVVDMRLLLGLPKVEPTVDTSIIIIEIAWQEEVLILGALVDAVQDVVTLNSEQIEPPPRWGMRLKTEFIQGMGRINEGFMMMLNIDKVFSMDELTLAQEFSEDALLSEKAIPN